MKPEIALDFLARDPRVPVAGIALLGVALGLAALLGLQFAQLRAEIAAQNEALQAARPAPPRVRPAPPESAVDLKRAQGVLRRLAAPWNALFAEVEVAVGANVALLAIQPDVGNARVTLTGEAKNLREALAFAERLNGGKVLSEAILGGHEVRVQDPHRPVRFTIEARWPQAAETRL